MERKETKDKSRKVWSDHLCMPWQDLFVTILMSIGQSDGHSLDPSGIREAHEIQNSMG